MDESSLIFPFLLKVCPPPLVTIIAFGRLSAKVTALFTFSARKKKGFEINVCNGALHSNANGMVRQSVGQ